VHDLFIIERGAPALSELDVEQATQELMENTDDAYGFPPYRYVAPVLHIGGEHYESLRAKEEGVLRRALLSMRVRRLASDSFGWADEIPKLLTPGRTGEATGY
jgi:hypothetical protein